MSIDAVKKFIELVRNDEDLVRELVEIKTEEEKLALAKAHGCEFTAEEAKAVSETSEINDVELDKVSAAGEVANCILPLVL